MFIDDADRLDSIKALGGQLVRVDGRPIWAVFENEFVPADVGLEVESSGPMLDPVRSSDVLGIAKDAPVEIGQERYRVKRLEPDAGAGMTRVLLKR